MSTDQAHSIGDVLGAHLVPTGRREPTRVLAELDTADAGGGSLDALALDTLALLAATLVFLAGALRAGAFLAVFLAAAVFEEVDLAAFLAVVLVSVTVFLVAVFSAAAAFFA